jgi:1-acyl-sn-glycerol-3-phosphate acyltransferase
VFFRREWRGLENIPRTGAALIVVNHVSVADTMTVARMVWDAGRLPRFLIQDEVFTWPLVGRAFRGCGQIPVERGSVHAREALAPAVASLLAGHVVVIYPEGAVTTDPRGWPMQAHTGVARLALACPDVPIIPVGQWGAQNAWSHRPGRRRHVRPFPRALVQASVGLPVDLGPLRAASADPDHANPDHETLRELTDHIMAAVTGQLERVRGDTRPDEIDGDLAG